jgi:hypothetical protein
VASVSGFTWVANFSRVGSAIWHLPVHPGIMIYHDKSSFAMMDLDMSRSPSFTGHASNLYLVVFSEPPSFSLGLKMLTPPSPAAVAANPSGIAQ